MWERGQSLQYVGNKEAIMTIHRQETSNCDITQATHGVCDNMWAVKSNCDITRNINVKIERQQMNNCDNTQARNVNYGKTQATTNGQSSQYAILTSISNAVFPDNKGAFSGTRTGRV